jgi:hypothetical protein
MGFSVKINLPSGKAVRVPELKNSDYFTILKFCENEDLEGLCNFFNLCLFNNLTGLDIVDKFYILLLVRMMYVDPELILENEEKTNINFSIQNIIDNIDSAEFDFNKVYRDDKYILELGLPDSLYFDSLNDIFLSIIKKIQISDTEIDFGSLKEEEREEVLNYIPNSIFTILKKHITIISSDLSDFAVIDGSDEFGIKGINLDIVSNGVITFLMSIFSTGLTGFFEMMYIFTSKLGFTAQDFLNLTPLDSKVILNIFKKEQSEREEELKKQGEV